ncbi:MAG TPA: chromate transporter [Casimicrobiaceae bacterium]|nr:chromate transporter [Casimicrobiaceae bacterium]
MKSLVLPEVSSRALFFRFLEVGLSGFGGVMPIAHRSLVERHQWLSEAEFTEMLSMAQVLPGPNIVNITIMVGRKFGGWRGALAAFCGLLLMPMVIVILLAVVYARLSDLAVVQHAFTGVAASASGLVLAMGFKMARAVPRGIAMMAIALIAFVAIGVLRLPLMWVLAAMAPVAIAIAWMTRTR